MNSVDQVETAQAGDTRAAEPLLRSGGWHAAALLLLAASGVLVAFVAVNRLWPSPWTEVQKGALAELSLDNLAGVPPDPSNRYAESPEAARLGARLFRDPRLSGNGRLSCAGCHKPELSFTDGLSLAHGGETGTRNTPSVVPTAYASTFFWDGRRDSQWAQALGPLESAKEMMGTRSGIVSVIARHYKADYESVFGPLPSILLERLDQGASPLGSAKARAAWLAMSSDEQDSIDRAFANVGKAISAYERTLRFEPSRFDRYVSHVQKGNNLLAQLLFSEDERAGLELFTGRGNCTNCHRGAMFTGHEFFALALPFGASGPDAGRADGMDLLRRDPFNCLGKFSDAKPEQCTELRYLATDHMGFLANFKTPSLRNVAVTAPYMHAGQLETLGDVLDHYSRAPDVPFPEHTDIQPLGLSDLELRQLVAFLGTLTSRIQDPYATMVPAP